MSVTACNPEDVAARDRAPELGADAGAKHGVVVVAASAGGVDALTQLLGAMPADFPLPIAIVQHRTPSHPSALTRILAQHTGLTVKAAEPGEPLRPGTVYVAPPDRHLTVDADRTLAVRDGRRIQHVLSSADPLFASAAEVFGGDVIAVVLTGSGMDGADGVRSVKARGGTVIAQDPLTSAFSQMPSAAIATGAVDYVLPLADIAPALACLAGSSGR